ncbi:MAG: HAMP domain-containing methyl-accepting chemotaxis protein [Nitrospiraceae bacterium]|nr:HAMP domain-containing methyl-accepting chemotaxis protein [Nitrospiraceae bacterium]
MSRRSIKSKLNISISLVVLAVVFMAFFSVFLVVNTRDLSKAVLRYRGSREELKTWQDLQLQTADMWQFFTDASLTRDRASIDRDAQGALEAARKDIGQLAGFNAARPEISDKLKTIRDNIESMWQTGNSMYDAYGAGLKQGNAIMGKFDSAGDSSIKGIASILEKREADADAGIGAVSRMLAGAVKVMAAIAVLLGLMGGLIIMGMVAVRNSITRSIADMIQAAETLASGDLTVDFGEKAKGGDEMSMLFASMDKVASSFNAMIAEITGSASKVVETVGALRDDAQKTSERAQGQSLQASQTAAASEEMTQTINEIARNAANVSENSRKACDIAEAGRTAASGAIATSERVYESTAELEKKMVHLDQKASEIGDIVSVINDIADQTTLLALNASIEAARANEHGKGFAVVAEEVRKLAEKTIKATADVSGRIRQVQRETRDTSRAMKVSTDEVKKATGEISGLGTALSAIVEQAMKMKDQITQIAVSVDEQSSVASQITENMESSSSIAREMDMTSQDLMEQVNRLSGVVQALRDSTTGFRTK